jgi:hypothetical protein
VLTAGNAGALSDCLSERGRVSRFNTLAASVSGPVVGSIQRGGWSTRPTARFSRVARSGVVEMGRWQANRYVADIRIDAATALVTADGGLVALDLSDPRQPIELDSVTLVDAQQLAVDGGLACVAASGDDGIVRFDIVDITDPSNLQRLGGLVWEGSQPAVNAIVADDGIVVIADDAGLRIIDIGDPWFPVQRARWSRSTTRDVALVGSHAIVAADDPSRPGSLAVTVVDLSDPARPVAVGAWRAPSDVLSIAEYGGAVLAGTANDGIYHIDLSDPTQPTIIEHRHEPGFEIEHIATAWPTVAMSDSRYGTEILGLARACIPPRQSWRKSSP